jgi:hypothetical protein
MKSTITLLGIFTLFSVNSQVATTSIQFNNAKGLITDAGVFFTDLANALAGYEAPASSGKNLIYSSAFWFGGTDMNGQLKLAAQNMYNQSSDLWPGALTADGTALTVSPNPLGQTLWNVSRSEINQHIASYGQSGYVVPAAILNWPAHGDVASGQSTYLAPFVDVNFNGVYEPNLGDQPCIKGDYAVYTIMNDKGDVHGSGGDPIGLEIHFMFYQFASNDALNNTTFIDVEIHNRGTQTINDFSTSFIMDGDIGGPSDDFVGCDSTRNLMFQYNADDFDDDMSAANGYGANPPSFGVMLLNDTLTSCLGFNSSDPQFSNASEMYNLMQGLNANGTEIYDADMLETKFQYYDNPNNSIGWSEETALNAPGDRRSVMSIVVPQFIPFTKISYSYAVVYSRDGANNLANVNELLDVADQIQLYYDNNIEGECEFTLATSELEIIYLTIYPNPSNGNFTVNPNGVHVNRVVVRDMAGRKVYNEKVDTNLNVNLQLNSDKGMYIVTMETILGNYSRMIVIE